MTARGTVIRTTALCLCLVVSTVALGRASKSEPTLPREPFERLPMKIGEFQGTRALDLEQEIVDVLGVEEYLNRTYRAEGSPLPVGFYLGYWASQREGDAIHSPMNCLPGSGWQPIAQSRIPLTLGGVAADVNRVIVDKSGERVLVLYWYQSHGRVIASEYWSKIHMVLDAIRTNRTDAALVRVIVPIRVRDENGEAAAEKEALAFVHSLFPHLARHLPV
jgi:EpsI family protein